MSQRVICPIIPSSCLSKGEASYAKVMGQCPLFNKSGTPYIFEILRISQHSISVKLLITLYYYDY